MLFQIKRKLTTNRKVNRLFLVIIAVLVSFLSIGYSALNQSLMISGEVAYLPNTSTLYDVLKRAAKVGTYAAKYTGDHQDSWSGDGDKDIYYWYATSDANGTAIQNMNNVIFAGHCWQMIRTTDTGGVKMIYNGESVNNQCLNTRGTHIGYTSRQTQTMSTTYYYGTDYTYDSTNNVFSLSGDVTKGTINVGQYTCKSTSATGTCATLYLVDALKSDTTYHTFLLSKSSHYSQFGNLEYNQNYNSPAYVGYMYNKEYPVVQKNKKFSISVTTQTLN